MWQANPAEPFADGEDEDLLDIYLEFERYRDCLSRCIIYADLRSRRRQRILKAATRRESLVRMDSADEQAWALLFRARASLPGRDTALALLLERIRQYSPAASLLSCATSSIGSAPGTPMRRSSSISVPGHLTISSASTS